MAPTGQLVSTVYSYFPTYGLTYVPQTKTMYVTGGFGISLLKFADTYPSIRITTSPSNAIVTVNGIALQGTNGVYSGNYPDGGYFINVTSPGYLPYSDYAYITSISHCLMFVSLTQLTSHGELSGSISPANAVVLANGIPIPVANSEFTQSLAPGTYYVSFTAKGYTPILEKIEVQSGKTVYLNKTMSTVSNSVTLSGQIFPASASLMVDGFAAYVNSTGYYSINVPSGKYTISLFSDGFLPHSEQMTISATMTKDFSLVSLPSLTSSFAKGGLAVNGYNSVISNVEKENGKVTVSYNTTSSGQILLSAPISSLENATVSSVLGSTVEVNGAQYNDYTVAITGNYTVLLLVNNLSGTDQNIVWNYLASAPGTSPDYTIYYIVGAVAAVAAIAGVVLLTRSRRKNKP